MTVALALILFALLMLYCGIKGRSLKSALIGKAEAGADGSLIPKSQ